MILFIFFCALKRGCPVNKRNSRYCKKGKCFLQCFLKKLLSKVISKPTWNNISKKYNRVGFAEGALIVDTK